MYKQIKIGTVDIFLTHDDYCNTCKFRRYINHEIKYTCLLFGGEIERDGNNFIRLERCKDFERSGENV